MKQLSNNNYELIGRYAKSQDAIAYVERFHKNLPIKFDENVSEHHGLTDAGREILRERMLGENNINAAGLSDAHKAKISNTMKKKHHGEFHPMYNRKHKPSSKLKTSISMSLLPKRKWALDADGNEHFIFATDTLPEGWVWGRARGSGKTGV